MIRLRILGRPAHVPSAVDVNKHRQKVLVAWSPLRHRREDIEVETVFASYNSRGSTEQGLHIWLEALRRLPLAHADSLPARCLHGGLQAQLARWRLGERDGAEGVEGTRPCRLLLHAPELPLRHCDEAGVCRCICRP